MEKRNLKILIRDLEVLLAELKAEVYSDTSAYTQSKYDYPYASTYLITNDDDGETD